MKRFNIKEWQDKNIIKEDQSLITEIGALGIAGGIVGGVVGLVVLYNLWGLTKWGIAAGAVALGNKLQNAKAKKEIKQNVNLIKGALGRLRKDPVFKELVQLLIDNPYGGTDNMKTKAGKIAVKSKDDFNAMKKRRTAAIKEFKAYLSKKLNTEEQRKFSDIYDIAKNG